jgi:hypothetical protein
MARIRKKKFESEKNKEDSQMKNTKSIIILAIIIGLFTISAMADKNKVFSDGKSWGPTEAQIKIKLYTDKPSYQIGEQAKIAVVADSDCYFMLYSIDSDGEAALVCPSNYSAFNKLKKNEVLYIRDKKGNFLQQKGPAGNETLQVIASKEPIDTSLFSSYVSPTTGVTIVSNPPEFVAVISNELKSRAKSWGEVSKTSSAATAEGVYGIATATYSVKP